MGYQLVEILPTRLVTGNGTADRMLCATLLEAPVPLWHEDSIMV